MPKGIRKACANCIKARLACDEGRPCQRCVVHQCECVAVARKPRVKKQKLDLEPPVVAETKPTNIPTIDSNVEVVVPNWIQNDFVQNGYGSFQLDKPMTLEDIPSYDTYNSPSNILSPLGSRLSPGSALDSPPIMMPASTPSPTIQQSPPLSQPNTPSSQSPPSAWVQRQLQTALQQYMSQAAVTNTALSGVQNLPQPPVQHTPQPAPPQQPTPQLPQSLQLPQSVLQLLSPQQMLAYFQRQQQALLLNRTLDNTQQMLSLLMEEKPSTLLNEWQDNPALNSYLDNQQAIANFANSLGGAPFKNTTSSKHSHMQPLPQAKNSTPLFPAPIAVFDKQRFQLLDANEAMANFVGHTNVASLSTEVVTMDDLVNPEAAHIAKNAFHNFISNPSPCFRIGEVRTRGGQNKTVEFHVDLTEQLLIFTVKSVLDTCLQALPDSTHSFKKDISQQCNCKACEFLSPID